MGDPSGIGPEVTLKALASPKVRGLADFIIAGNAFVFGKLTRDLGLKFNGRLVNIDNIPQKIFAYGRSHPVFGRAAMQYIDKALDIIGSRGADAASLRMALLVLAPTGFWAVCHFCMASRTIVADQQRAVGYVTVREGLRT